MIPQDRLPIVLTTKYYRIGPEEITIFLFEEKDLNKARKWRQLNEELYVVILPTAELERQQVIIKTK